LNGNKNIFAKNIIIYCEELEKQELIDSLYK